MKYVAHNMKSSSVSFSPELSGEDGTKNITKIATIAALRRNICALFFLLMLVPGLALAQKPRIFYTDLDSGPNTGGQSSAGAFVTLYGNYFGSSQGSSTVTVGGGAVSSYPVWSNTKVTVQLGASAVTGNIVLTTSSGASNGIPFTVRSGNIYFVSTSGSDGAAGSYSAPWLTLTHARDTIAAGDIVYAENGVAQTTDDGTGWSSCFTIGANAGSAGKPKAMVVYPGATATIGNVNSTSDGGCDTGIRAKGQGESYWTFAGFTLRGGSVAINPYGETDWRIVANDVSCPNGNAQAGCMDIGTGTGTYVYGNDIHNVATNLSPGSVTALYHGVYISEFNTALDFGWNTIAYVEGGRGLQQNVNEGNSSYNLLIHDNIIHDTQLDGIVMTTVDPSKGPVEIYNNLIYNTGTGPANAEDSGTWTCMNLEAYDPSGYGPGSGNYQVYNNTMYNCGNWTDPPYPDSEGMLIFEPVSGTSKGMILTNNIIYASTVSAYCADSNACNSTSGSNNIFYGNGAAPTNSSITDSINSNPDLTSLSTPNFQLQSGSPAIDAGVTESIVVTDFQGLTRPQGTAYDIGAYEVYGGGGGSTMTLSASPTSLAFGNVVDGSSSSLETTITNTGNEDVTISSASISGTGYTITSQPLYPDVLAANDSATYMVKFAPTSSGLTSGGVTVTSNATNSPTEVSLSGTGVTSTKLLSASPTSLAFGNVTDGSSSSLQTTITNTGNTNVSISSASISGTGYTITSQPSYPDVLAPNDTATYTVKFAPTVSGLASGTLAATSNATDSPTDVSLSGTGVASGSISVAKTGGNGTGSEGDSSGITASWNGGGSTTGSDAIIVVVYGNLEQSTAYTASNITDSAGNTYHLDQTITHPHTGKVYVFSCLNASAASSVTVTPPAYDDFQFVAMEAEGLAASSAHDKAGTVHDNGFYGSGSPEDWTTNASGTLTTEPELVLAINADPYGTITAFSGTGYTQEVLRASASGEVAVLGKVATSTSSVTPSGTYTATGGSWVGSFVTTYK